MSDSPIIWIANQPKQRLTHVYFRKEVTITSLPKKATISLYAYTMYHFHVNGTILGMGPARSYPEFPEYDTYDIAPFLKDGINVIAVEVSHVGITTFHHPFAEGGLQVWGSIESTDGNVVDVSTANEWKCCLVEGYEPNPPCFSFAIGPIQILDERKAPANWDKPGISLDNWTDPIEQDASIWGTMRPRMIPHLTQQEKLPQVLVGAHHFDKDTTIVSFHHAQDTTDLQNKQHSSHMFAYTYIYSPQKLSVPMSIWWGEYSLNGKKVQVNAVPSEPSRQEAIFDLDKGWNFLFAAYKVVLGLWEFQMAFPSRIGLFFSADKEQNGKTPFRVTPALPTDEIQTVLETFPPASLEDASIPSDSWMDKATSNAGASPTRGLAWRTFQESLPFPSYKVQDFIIPANQDTSLVFDMGIITLGRIFVEYEAPEGTIIDVGYAEDLKDKRPHYYKMVLVSSGERQIARGGVSRMETFAPRGSRFVEIGVTNHTDTVKIRRIGMVEQRYPYEKQGSFSCSDPFFNTLWEYGWETLKLCSEDVITDTPWRERSLYAGDLLVECATTLVTARDLRLVRRCIEVFLQSQNENTGWLSLRAPHGKGLESLYDYQFIVLVNAEWYCRLENDIAFAERCFPVFEHLIRSVLATQTDDGLFPAVYPAFIDPGFKAKGLTFLCTVNALMVQVFKAWSSMLTMLGKTAEARENMEIAEKLAKLINERFWDDSVKAFTDVLMDESQTAGHGIPANAWAIMFGDVPPEKQQNANNRMAALMENFDPYKMSESISTYGAFYLLGALYETGAVRFAEESMRTIYQLMITESTGTIWEYPHPKNSTSHAWSTAPNYYLSTRTLGVRLGFPENTNLDEIMIAPQSETLQWARGTVPHPRGSVWVAWEIKGDNLFLSYQAPEGVKVTVMPQGRLEKLRLICNS